MKYYLVLFILLLIIFGVPRLYAKRKRKRTTSITTGKITSFIGDEDGGTWHVSFTVNGKVYTISMMERTARDKSLREHVGEEVMVRYDPENPKCAWADVPGKTYYSANR